MYFLPRVARGDCFNSGWPTRPNPTNIANASPDPPTLADRVVPILGWRLVIVPYGLILCAGAGSIHSFFSFSFSVFFLA